MQQKIEKFLDKNKPLSASGLNEFSLLVQLYSTMKGK